MLKTIKETKRMRLDELIKYVRQNKKTLFEEHVTISFKTKDNKGVIFANNGNFVTTGDCINIDDIFEVVIEEEITEDTEFYGIQEVYLDIDEQEIIVENLLEKQTIRDVLNNHDDSSKCLQIYALINEKRELIWEADND